jgi:hypothetical protein
MKALVLCKEDFKKDPRPNRIVNFFLKNNINLTVLSSHKNKVPGIDIYSWNNLMKSNFIAKVFYKIAELLILVISKFFNTYFIFTLSNKILNYKTYKKLKLSEFDIIVVHNIELLPISLEIKSIKTKILFDAREYYVNNFDDQYKWKILVKPFMYYLTKNFMTKCDWVITVSDGLSRAYKKNFNIDSTVVMSLANYIDLEPVINNNDKIKIIHHGIASKSRQIERMIYMMDHVDERFQLDLMLIKGNLKYWKFLNKLVSERKNVNLLTPVSFSEIVPFTNNYDIGLFLCYPSNFNLKHALPNKFFEFIQARLLIAIGPSIEMKKIVDEYNIGIVADNFEPETLAKKLNSLNSDTINLIKNNTHNAAKLLNSNKVFKDLYNILTDEENSNY